MSANEKHAMDECAKVFAAIPLIRSLSQVGKDEIVGALVRNCQSDEHVKEVLRLFVENMLEWKNPVAELVAIARTTEKHDSAPAGCDNCWIGPDLETGEIRWAYFVVRKVRRRCECARGRWFRAKKADPLFDTPEPPGCPICSIVTDGPPQWSDFVMVDISARCDCARGRWFKAKDEETAKKPAQKEEQRQAVRKPMTRFDRSAVQFDGKEAATGGDDE